jgi:hypothetical protein
LENAEELDFFNTAEILETTAKEHRREIPPEHYYPMLEKNKDAFGCCIQKRYRKQT